MFSSSNFWGMEGESKKEKRRMGSTAIMECHFRGYENDNYCYKGGLSGE